jgi:hypothetical protein
LPSFEESVGGDIEKATRRMLPESTAVPIDAEFVAEKEKIGVGADSDNR